MVDVKATGRKRRTALDDAEENTRRVSTKGNANKTRLPQIYGPAFDDLMRTAKQPDERIPAHEDFGR